MLFIPLLSLEKTYIYFKSPKYSVIPLGASCNRLELLVLFTILCVCYPRKLEKIKFCSLYLEFNNTSAQYFRNYILTLMAIHRSEYFELFSSLCVCFRCIWFNISTGYLWADKYSHLKLKKGESGEK
jgi:hypothetical protein